MAFNIADMFEHAVDAVPDRTALIVGDRRRSYLQLEERANRLAHHLAAHRIRQGDHVGIYGRNSIEWVEAMLAIFKLRAVPINVNFRYLEGELHYLFDNADLKAIILERIYCDRLIAVAPELDRLEHKIAYGDDSEAPCSELGVADYEEALRESSPHRDFGERSDDDLYVLYTGGTTGMPKGVMWRHEDVFRALGGGIDRRSGKPLPSPKTLSEQASGNPAMVSMPVAPLMHGAAQWGTIGALLAGNTVVLMPKFDTEALWETVARERVQSISITGDAMARPMVETLAENHGRWDLSCLVALTSSAAVFSRSVKQQLMDLLPDVLITDAVGSSETGFSGSAPATRDTSTESTGGTTVTMGPDTVVLDEETYEPLPPGSEKIGLIARSGSIPVGYYKDPEKTAKTFIEVHQRRYAVPGDYARHEADGRLTLLGRGSVCINSGGEKIYPEEVEAVLKSHPAVFDAVVVGVPDERWSERVAAIVQPRLAYEPTLDELDHHCRQQIAGYKVPRQLHLVETVQRQPSGKPDYPWAMRVTTDQPTD